jgi:hypothetical protein
MTGFHEPAAKTYQENLFRQSIPAANFFVEDIEKEYARPGRGVYHEPIKNDRVNHSCA